MAKTKPESSIAPSDKVFVRRLMLVVLTGVALATLWLCADLLLLLFAAVLVAMLLHAISDTLRRWVPLSERAGLVAAGCLAGSIVIAGVWLFGTQTLAQAQGLARGLNGAFTALIEAIQRSPLADIVTTTPSASGIGSLTAKMLSWSTSVLAVAASLLVVVFAGIYLAFDPARYRDGLLKLIPPEARPRIAATLEDCGTALRRWIGVQLIAMGVIGLLVTGGLLLIGAPSAAALGVIAGVLELVPYVGPVAAAVPALLIASAHSWQMTALTLAVYVIIQQIENNIIMPLLVSRSVSVAPALAIFGILAMGLIFGPLGLMLGFPLLIVADIAVRRLYVLDALDTPVEILGAPARPSDDAVAKTPSDQQKKLAPF